MCAMSSSKIFWKFSRIMAHYMQFTQCMFKQSSINNGAVVHMHFPPSNVMFGSGSGAGGPPGDGGPQGGQRDGTADDGLQRG